MDKRKRAEGPAISADPRGTVKQSLRQSMSSLHTWTGLLPGWLLFVIFLFGTVAYYQQEISRWMRPELSSAALSSGALSPAALDAADALLRGKAPTAAEWSLSFPEGRGGDGLAVSWPKTEPAAAAAGGKRPKPHEVTLDPRSGIVVEPRDTRGGYFLYRMHFDLHYMPVMWARYLVSIAALAMLVAILSGVVTHKKIFADFFLLRFGKGQRSWLDAHNVTAVMALPFYLMITYTGLVTLLFTLMPWAISANFASQEAYYDVAFPSAPTLAPSGRRAAVLPLRRLIASAQREIPGFEPGYITIANPGDAVATAEMYPQYDTLGSQRGAIVLNAATGKVLRAPPRAGGATMTKDTMIDLHAGRYSGPGLRALYFLSGALGTVMVATGLVLWTVKRRAKLPDPTRPHFGFRVAERLNIGVIVGAPAGIAMYFLANRLLPLGLENRADYEINSLFIAWGAILVWGAARPARMAWIESLAACAALYALVPVVNALTTQRGLLASLREGDGIFVCFDLGMLLVAAIFAFAAWRVRTRRARPAPRRKQRDTNGAFA